jgi:hypothetical protein
MRFSRTLTLYAALLAAATPAAAEPQPRGEALLRETMLSTHNAARAAVGAPALAWDEALAASARAYAETLARTGLFRHDPALATSEEQGENLWRGDAGRYGYAAMAQGWLAERGLFVNRAFPDVSTSGRWEDVGHYTQMVWRRTRRVGCALARGAADDYLVCRYAEPGNWDGETAY